MQLYTDKYHFERRLENAVFFKRIRLVLFLFYVFFLLLLYRSFSLLVPNPHWNLTLKRQQQHNGLSLLLYGPSRLQQQPSRG